MDRYWTCWRHWFWVSKSRLQQYITCQWKRISSNCSFSIYYSNYQNIIYFSNNAIDGAFLNRNWYPFVWEYMIVSEVPPFDSTISWQFFLQIYINIFIQNFIEEQVQYFTNSQRVIYFCIITAAELFHGFIAEYKLIIADMPPAKISSLVESIEEEML